MILKSILAASILLFAGAASASLITYTDTDLGSGNPVTVSGTTLTTSTVGGNIGFIPGSGGFAGLWLGGNNSSGSYTLSFSSTISSIEIEFDALSSIGPLPVETLFGFATSNGAVSISYVNDGGTSFDGTTITSLVNDGQGTISFSGASFTSFSFNHNQGQQSGFVIERVTINTDQVTAVPEPGSLSVLGLAAVAMFGLRRGRAAALLRALRPR